MFAYVKFSISRRNINRNARWQDRRNVAPDLIVELLSPSTVKNDKGYKKDLHEKCGVKEYWIVEIETLSVEVYLLEEGKFILNEIYRIIPDYEVEDMTEEEKSSTIYEFKTSLYPDLTIVLDEIFEGRF